MRVRILSGSQTGAIVEMGQSEAESAIATGYAAVELELVAAPEAPQLEAPTSAPDDGAPTQPEGQPSTEARPEDQASEPKPPSEGGGAQPTESEEAAK